MKAKKNRLTARMNNFVGVLFMIILLNNYLSIKLKRKE